MGALAAIRKRGKGKKNGKLNRGRCALGWERREREREREDKEKERKKGEERKGKKKTTTKKIAAKIEERRTFAGNVLLFFSTLSRKREKRENG
jgi:hypothetical protein